MENVFKKMVSHNTFTWENIGNIKEGHGDLGESMPVLVYRLMQYTMLDVLNSCIFVLDSPYSKWQLDTFKNLQRTERREHEAFSRFIHV